VAFIAGYGGLAGLMTVDAPFHADRLRGLYDRLLRHIAVTGAALHTGRRMFPVAEKDEIGNLVDTARWDFALRHADMANPALPYRGEGGQVFCARAAMARDALQLEWRVLPVIERFRLVRRAESYCKEKATKESE
jgi:hypothetical protein